MVQVKYLYSQKDIASNTVTYPSTSKSSYDANALSYVITLFIQMSMDQRCEAIAYDIEKAIRCCLDSYSQSMWKREVNS
jgi:hypothetical protein